MVGLHWELKVYIKFVKLLKGGYEVCEVLYHWDVAEAPYRQGAWADAPAPIDATSGRLYPFADGEALFIAEFAGETGRLAPRNLLKDQLARAGAMGARAERLPTVGAFAESRRPRVSR